MSIAQEGGAKTEELNGKGKPKRYMLYILETTELYLLIFISNS